jgi:hypothetical protein
MARGQAIAEVGEQLGKLPRKVIRCGLPPVTLKREGGRRVRAGGAAEPEVYATGRERREHAEALGDLERAVMRQHDAAASDADARCRGSDGSNEDFRAGAGQHRRSVMLGDPVPVIAQPIGEAREIERVPQRVDTGESFRDGRLIQNAQPQP